MTLQTFFFCEALEEQNINPRKASVNHMDGTCFHKAIGNVPIIFPLRIVKKVAEISKEKHLEAFFMGKISDGRDWILKYDNVSESLYGRNSETKYSFHDEYYEKLSSAKFGISPTGDCPWSYRFFEAIMCHAVPVISDTETDIFSQGFSFYRDSQEKLYDTDLCLENYELFLKRHTLLGYV